MKEKPIIFTAESVNAIRNGRKTQTRRVMKIQPEFRDGVYYWPTEADIAAYGTSAAELNQSIFRYAPYKVGDRLWVRETWRPYSESETAYAALQYKAGGESVTATDYQIESVMNGTDNWRSPIFMPRWASRITLEVTAVRVERLQDISIKDVKEEGVTDPQSLSDPPSDTGRPIEWFSAAWDKLNGKRAPWKSNSWVWVIEFKMLEVNQ